MERNDITPTIQDCIDMYDIKGQATIINDGQIKGFEYEKEITK